MRWDVFLGSTVAIGAIFAFEWPKMKRHPLKDKAAFLVLLLFGWGLAQFDLQYMSGPVTFLEAVFRPFSKMLNME